MLLSRGVNVEWLREFVEEHIDYKVVFYLFMHALVDVTAEAAAEDARAGAVSVHFCRLVVDVTHPRVDVTHTHGLT
eukprot:9211297-Pyramimonas_sp.AAC.1